MVGLALAINHFNRKVGEEKSPEMKPAAAADTSLTIGGYEDGEYEE